MSNESSHPQNNTPNAKFSGKFKLVWCIIYLLGILLFISGMQSSLNLLFGVIVFGFFWIPGSLFLMMPISLLMDLD